MKLAFLGLLSAWAIAGSAGAQPYNTDIIATRFGGSNVVVRIDNAGAGTTLASGLRFFANMVCMANNNTDVVVGLPSSPPEVLEIDGTTGLIVRTLHSGAPLSFINYFAPTGEGDYVVAANTAVYHIRGNGTGARTVASGVPFFDLQSVVQDLVTGGYVVGDVRNNLVYFLSPAGAITRTVRIAGVLPFAITQDHRDGTIHVGSGAAGSLHAVSHGGTTTTLNGALGTNAGAIDFDRWTGNGAIVVGSDPLLRVDPTTGAVVKAHPNQGGINTGLCFDRGRNLVALDDGNNRHRIVVSIPTEVGRFYVIAASRSGITPGLPIAGRRVHLAVDDVFLLSAQGALAPFLVNNRGRLDAGGRAVARLDLSRFTGLAGVRLWFAAATFDPNAPGGVGVITKPIVVLLD